jgi:1-acyl-sn-glycerol-3-phosphate acyltransferase
MKKILLHPSTWSWIITYLLMSLFSSKKDILYAKRDVENLHQGTIFVLNHRNILDPWIFFHSLPFKVLLRVLPIRIYSSSVFKNSTTTLRLLDKLQITNLIYWIYGCIKVPVEGTLIDKVSVLFPAIEKNHSILIFPEGRVNRTPEISEIKEGITLLRRKYKDKKFFFSCLNYPKNDKGVRVPKVIFGEIENGMSDDFKDYEFSKYSEYVRGKLQALYDKIR